eukprot:TRINITY_DN43582_c0_g1_i1.p1 TRINITY_DN43582_c0_g1~~TRINITY_DN43582_c0_g1_i1.p1  ORF type:complete len:255 (+),score=24.20 TRINITY_DN43582_c0_g1_i1:28-765(+)
MAISLARLALTTFCMGSVQSAGPGPRLPDRFAAKFEELIYIYDAQAPDGVGKLLGNSTGSWSYDLPSSRWVYEHGPDGMFSMFCAANDPQRQRCWMHFSETADLRIRYANGSCCTLCSTADGCGMLRPDFLTHGGFIPVPQPAAVIDGATCIGWGRPGAVTSIDSWFVTEDGTPCEYFERIPSEHGVFMHNLTFKRDTYSTAPIDEEVFALPDSCSKLCPKHGYPPRSEAEDGKSGGSQETVMVI